MPLIDIEHADDARLAPYLGIRERDLVGREGRFVAEGKVVLDMLVRSARFSTESILVLPSRLSGLEKTLELVPEDVPIYVVSPAVMDHVAGFPVHRGILAVGTRPQTPGIADILNACGDEAIVVAAAGIANHDNIGAIFRNAAAFGAAAVVMDETSCDPLYRKAIRVSAGTVLDLPFARQGSVAGMIDTLEAAGFALLALSPSGRTDLWHTPRSKKTALLLGTEGEGLPTDILSRLATARIPMRAGIDSLNVATTAALALYELRRGFSE